MEPKRPGRPVDITALCRLSPTVPNHVDVSWASEFGRVCQTNDVIFFPMVASKLYGMKNTSIIFDEDN